MSCFYEINYRKGKKMRNYPMFGKVQTNNNKSESQIIIDYKRKLIKKLEEEKENAYNKHSDNVMGLIKAIQIVKSTKW